MKIYIFVPNYIYYFSILIVFISIILYLKSSLAENYLISLLLHTIFFKPYVTLSTVTRGVIK
jgi:hypothetical protein